MREFSAAVAGLAHAACADHRLHPDHGGGERPSASAYADKLFDGVEADGAFTALGSADALRAYIAWTRTDDDPGFRCPITRVHTDHVLGDVEAAEWVATRVRSLAPSLERDADVMLKPCYRSTAQVWLDVGFRVSSVMLVGRTRQALDRLVAAKDPPDTFEALGLTGRLAHPTDADALVDLQRVIFSAEPEYCWFGAGERFLESWRQSIVDGTAGGRLEVLVLDGRIVGMFNTDWKTNPMWGLMGGFGLFFLPEIRGRGLVKTAYRRGLTALAEREVPLFRGSTSQPSVMGLAGVMGRELCMWSLRRDEFFEEDHWGAHGVRR